MQEVLYDLPGCALSEVALRLLIGCSRPPLKEGSVRRTGNRGSTRNRSSRLLCKAAHYRTLQGCGSHPLFVSGSFL